MSSIQPRIHSFPYIHGGINGFGDSLHPVQQQLGFLHLSYHVGFSRQQCPLDFVSNRLFRKHIKLCCP